jgi:predicted Zn-dependent protease
MVHQEDYEAQREFERGRTALAANNCLVALPHLERALKLWDNPAWYSSLGFCIAKERGQVKRGLDLCRAALEKEPDNPYHYLCLGKVHLVAGDKAAALRVMREGMAKGGSEELQAKLAELGTRKTPVFPSLSRSNPLNKILGLLLSRLGHR